MNAITSIWMAAVLQGFKRNLFQPYMEMPGIEPEICYIKSRYSTNMAPSPGDGPYESINLKYGTSREPTAMQHMDELLDAGCADTSV